MITPMVVHYDLDVYIAELLECQFWATQDGFKDKCGVDIRIDPLCDNFIDKLLDTYEVIAQYQYSKKLQKDLIVGTLGIMQQVFNVLVYCCNVSVENIPELLQKSKTEEIQKCLFSFDVKDIKVDNAVTVFNKFSMDLSKVLDEPFNTDKFKIVTSDIPEEEYVEMGVCSIAYMAWEFTTLSTELTEQKRLCAEEIILLCKLLDIWCTVVYNRIEDYYSKLLNEVKFTQ